MLNITINDKVYQYKENILLKDICDEFQKDYKYPILVAFVDNEIYELNKVINKDCSIRFITLMDNVGNKIYQKGLIFLINYCFRLLYGNKEHLKARHSIDKGIMMQSSVIVNDDFINRLFNKMNEVVDMNLPINKCLVKRRDAQKYFVDINDLRKANTFKYVSNHYVNLHKLGDYYNYFYCNLPISTSVFKDFKLTYYNENKFVLQFPTVSSGGLIPEFKDQPKIIEAFDQTYKLAKRLNIYCLSDLNKIISKGNINSIIKLDETIASNRLLNMAQDIFDKKDLVKIVLIAGPSSSGKTTTSRKLAMFLKSFGLNPKYLSVDDYFKERIETPKLENGDYDFESINAIDINLFNDHLNRLLNGEEVSVPTFNFHSGEKEYLGRVVKLEKDDILIIEGLHAINEELTKTIPRINKYKVYLSALTDLNIDDQNMISTSDLRLMRRIVRDNRTRNYTALDTIKAWKNVRSGEEKYIFPYQNDVDFVCNSALIYEIGVLKLYVEPLLYDIDNTSEYYEEVRRLLNILNIFLPIPSDAIPSESILREFIGNSFFEEEI